MDFGIAENSPKKIGQLLNWLRWLLVFPGAVAVYWVLQIIIAFFWGQTMDFLPEFLANHIIQFFNTIIPAYYFVIVGAKIAPRFQFRTSLVLTILYILLTGILFGIAVINQGQREPLWWLIVMGVAGIIASVLACHTMMQESEL